MINLETNIFLKGNLFLAVEDDQDDQDAYFLMLPRVSYLPLVTDKVESDVSIAAITLYIFFIGEETFSSIH